MKKTRILASATILAASALLLTGCFGTSVNPKHLPTPAPTTSGSLSIGGTPGTPNPSATPTETATQDPNADPTTEAGMLNIATAMFPNAKAVGKYSKDDVLLSLYTADAYIHQSENNAEFISGAWAKGGYSTSILRGVFGNFFSTTGYGRMNDAADGLSKNFFQNYQNVFATVSFLPDSDKNDVCAANALNCLVAGYPKIGTYSFTQADDGSLLVSVHVDSRIAMKVGSKSGYYPVVKDFNLNFIKNDSYKDSQGQYPFVINTWSNSVRTTGFVS